MNGVQALEQENVQVTEEQARGAMDDYLQATSELQTMKADKMKEQMDLDNTYSVPIALLEERVRIAEKALEEYANTLELGDNRSIRFGPLTLGWRKARKSLGLKEGKTWDEVTQVMKTKFASLIKITAALDKKKVLEELEGNDAKKLERIGFEVTQKESFYVKLRD